MVVLRTVTLFFLVMISVSCQKENAFDCFKSTGKTIVETRTPGSFKTIELNSKINITIFKGNEHRLEVIAGQNVIKGISTKVVNDVLVIEDHNECNVVRGYKRTVNINVTVPYVTKVINAGVAKITFDKNFNQDTLIIRATNSGDVEVNGEFNQIRTSSHGNGDITVNGKANSLYIYTNGTNFVFAENLDVKDYIFVETLTIGDCSINADGLKRLEYHIHRSGNIYYTGNPTEINDFSNGTHSGKLVKKE